MTISGRGSRVGYPAEPSARRRPTRAPSRGFTLVELLITAGLLVVVLGLLFIPVSSSLGYFRTASARADAQAVARRALDAMAREITEAMYVQLDMYDNTMLSFVPPLRVNPYDPTSEIATPPRPDPDRAVRFWRALNDPTRDYSPGTHLAAGNAFFLARTIIPDPFYTGDQWNRWNDEWAVRQTERVAEGTTNWAPIPRAAHSDFDWRNWLGGPYRAGARTTTLQPGYPYLAVLHRYGPTLTPDAVRMYRNAVVALTPNAPEYDVIHLSFAPVAAAGERLQPTEGPYSPDYAVYRSRYPLWRLGAPYTGWSVLAGLSDVVERMKAQGMNEWARDPFVLIHRYVPRADLAAGGEYLLHAIGAFDPRTRTMKVLDINRNRIYDTGLPPDQRPMPLALTEPWFGFTVDWIDGSLRFDFPQPYGSAVITPPAELEIALSDYWRGYAPGTALGMFVVPESVSVKRVEVDSYGKVLHVLGVLRRVDCAPRDYRNEFQLGLDPAATGLVQPKYGWIRLPEHLAGGEATTSVQLLVDYRWRNNGLVPAGQTLADERPDIVTAYYRSAAVMDISIGVTRADPSAPPEKRIAQSAFLTRRVKLHNLLREIRYGED